jgi:hypothetical protein
VRPGYLAGRKDWSWRAALGRLTSTLVFGRNAQILLKNSQIKQLRKSLSCVHSVG